MNDVSIVECKDYSEREVKASLEKLLNISNYLDFVTPGMKIVIKANLVTFMKPEKAATTHPILLCELIKILKAKGAVVIVGDSPGGLYNSTFVNKVYSATGMNQIEKVGGILNQNFEQKIATFPNANVAKEFPYTSYLDEADAIINFCKLKTHGMMGMSCAVKNLFGTIPGTQKPEFHFKYPNHSDFAKMLIDLNEYFKPKLCIVDAVIGMEGNGPTAGNPKFIGALLASKNPYKLDLACSKIIGLTKENVPTLEESYKLGLIPETAEQLTCNENLDGYFISDYKNIFEHKSILFENNGFLVGKLAKKFIASRPELKKADCIGCGECARICPAKAIQIKNRKAIINRKKCIKCYCCQEFCPKGAMKVKRTAIAKFLSGKNKRE